MTNKGIIQAVGMVARALIYVFCAFTAVTVAVLYNAPSPYIRSSVSVETPIVIGESLHIHVDVERLKYCPFRIRREVVDSEGRIVLQMDVSRNPVHGDAYEIITPLDITPAPGKALYRSQVGSQCNSVQEIFPNWSEWFEQEIEFIPPEK